MPSRSDEVTFDPLVTAVRVFTTRRRHRREDEEQPAGRSVKRRYPFEALVFDTETTSDPAQRLLAGVWRMYRDDPDGKAGVTCVEEGLFYPDDLADWNPDGYRILADYAAGHESAAAPGYSSPESGRRLVLWPLSRWLEDRLHEYAYRHRDRCDLVGFNLLFDLTRVAAYWGPGSRAYRGGWSLGFRGSFRGRDKWGDLRYHPRLQARSIDPRRTLFGWGSLKKEDQDKIPTRGRFVDLRTLAFALTDESHNLETACSAFGDPYKKADIEYGRITPELIHYARQDVEHTALLYRNCLDELRRHEGIPLDPSKLYSPATVGTAYLQAMGVAKPAEQFRGISPRTHGWAMSAFFGGRAEARVVRTPVPVAYVDMTSMYPTVSALLGTWRLLTAEHIQRGDATREVQALLSQTDLTDRCLDPGFWAEHIGVTLVEIDRPDGVILPVRGEYDEASPDPRIGVNPLRYHGRLWYTLPDLIASNLLGGQPARIRRAVRLYPHGRQANLQPIRLRGGPPIDPARQDPFVELIRLRHQIRNDQAVPKAEQDRLNLFLKITANATAYGILARFDRRTLANPTNVTVYGPDRPFRSQTRYPEDPGPYCFPPIAATITAAARLLLALLEHHVTQAGGTYAFCDTDSMGILCHPTIRHIDAPTPDGTNRLSVLRPGQVQEILDRFDSLDPYRSPHIPHLWKPEHDSLKRPLWCYAISAKRYALYHTDPQGTPELLRLIDRAEVSDSETADRDETEGLAGWSEHGLGLYLDPTGPKPQRDPQGRRIWMRQAWEWVLTQAAGSPVPLPEWGDRYALTRFSLTGQATANWFAHYNQGRPRSEQIRAGSFGLLAHPAPLTTIRSLGTDPQTQSRLPAAPYDSDPRHWPDLPWYDRGTGQPIRLVTISPHHDPEAFQHAIGRGDVRISTLGDVLTRFPHQPEHKSLAPNGQPADRRAHGLLQRRPVESAPVLTNLIGKEANLLEERATGQTIDPADYQNTHGTRGDRWTQLVLPALQQMDVTEIMARTGRQKTAAYDARAGRSHPTGAEANPYRQAAIDWATQRLQEKGQRVPRHPDGILYRHLADVPPSRPITPRP